jgi:hypothetical protein
MHGVVINMGLVTASSSAARLRTGASTPPGAAGTPSPARTKCQRRRNGQERASRGRNGRQNAAGPSPGPDAHESELLGRGASGGTVGATLLTWTTGGRDGLITHLGWLLERVRGARLLGVLRHKDPHALPAPPQNLPCTTGRHKNEPFYQRSLGLTKRQMRSRTYSNPST